MEEKTEKKKKEQEVEKMLQKEEDEKMKVKEKGEERGEEEKKGMPEKGQNEELRYTAAVCSMQLKAGGA